MPIFVALLRGINVGGKNLIRMSALKDSFKAAGFEDVETFIQSGNVLFRATGSGRELARRIETRLSKTFDYEATVVVRSHAQMRAIVEGAPKGFGAKSGVQLCDVIFLKEPLTASAALKKIPLKEGVDRAYAGRGVIYTSRLASKATQSRLTRIISTPIYKSMTLRNWNTTTRLLGKMNEASGRRS
jgi:uncharacterized protein (DUF1697 family)